MKQQETLQKIQIYSLALLIIMAAVAWPFYDLLIVSSILVGGAIVNLSFWLLKKDLTKLLQGDLTAVKARFFIKYYARLALIAIVLFLLIKNGSVNVIGLLIGLSSIFFSIATVAIGNASKVINIKEAS